MLLVLTLSVLSPPAYDRSLRRTSPTEKLLQDYGYTIPIILELEYQGLIVIMGIHVATGGCMEVRIT